MHIAESDAQRATDVRRGDTIELRLPETPTTGFRWRWRLPPALRLIADEHVRPEAYPSPPGMGGQRRLAFDVIDAGCFELRAELARPWEDAPHRTLTFVIRAT